MSADPPAHEMTSFEEGAGGWWVVECACGWAAPDGAIPDMEIAAYVFGAHCYFRGYDDAGGEHHVP